MGGELDHPEQADGTPSTNYAELMQEAHAAAEVHDPADFDVEKARLLADLTKGSEERILHDKAQAAGAEATARATQYPEAAQDLMRIKGQFDADAAAQRQAADDLADSAGAQYDRKNNL